MFSFTTLAHISTETNGGRSFHQVITIITIEIKIKILLFAFDKKLSWKGDLCALNGCLFNGCVLIAHSISSAVPLLRGCGFINISVLLPLRTCSGISFGKTTSGTINPLWAANAVRITLNHSLINSD